jgi:alkylation response protein AidB-like acyl-CoA dehydrogenase
MIIIHVYIATLGRAVTAAAVGADTLRSVLREYLDNNAPVSTAVTDPGRTGAFVTAFQPASLLVPEQFGGVGGTASDAMAVAAESARALLGGEVLAQLLAAAALVWAPPTGLRADLLAGLASGEVRATAPVWTTADSPQLTDMVLASFPTSHAVVFDRTDGELRLRSVAATPEMIKVRNGMDPTRPLGRVRLVGDPAGADLARGSDAERVLGRYVAFARAALASEQVLGARRCVEMTTEYALQRTQFGVPIANFQAVKHTCATMHVNAAEAEALAARAAAAADDDRPLRSRLADEAKALASETFIAVARSAIEVHGGVAFAWEHPAQLFYKRALVTAACFGRPPELYAQIAGHSQTSLIQ